MTDSTSTLDDTSAITPSPDKFICPRCGEEWGYDPLSSDLHICPKRETVNHPSHYGGDTTYETIKVLEAWLTAEEYRGFLKGNVIKYLSRAQRKNGVEDYEKATWYQNHLNEFIKKD